MTSAAWRPPDAVHFSVTSPVRVAPGRSFVLNVWAHLERQRPELLARVQQMAGGAPVAVRTKGPIALEQGALLTVTVAIEGLIVEDAQDTMLWTGEIGGVDFPVKVPDQASFGVHSGVARLCAGGLQFARLYFGIEVGAAQAELVALPAREERHRKAFASYASQDRDAVLARVQGMCKVVPDLEVFLDVLSLRSGEDWAERLVRVIPESDVFYLFWSEYAARSEWVEREWRCALQAKGPGFIDPVPLVSPERVPPPPELAGKHFSDWTLALLRG